jgi:hypothetical protein
VSAWFPLFSLHSSHEFFAGGVCSTLDFVPTSSCDRLLLNAGVVIRQDGGRLTALADGDRLGGLPDTPLFDFHGYTSDPNFLNYTDGLALGSDGICYLCSTFADPAEHGRLSKNAYVSNDDWHAQSRIPPELLPEKPPTPAFLVRIAVDMRNPTTAHAYHIPLRARRTNWHYYICGSGVAGTDLYIADTSGEEAFEYCGEAVLPNGRSADHFRSKNPLPLLHRQPALYSLFDRHSARSVVKFLPTPSPRLIGRENLNGEKEPASQMFVNL